MVLNSIDRMRLCWISLKIIFNIIRNYQICYILALLNLLQYHFCLLKYFSITENEADPLNNDMWFLSKDGDEALDGNIPVSLISLLTLSYIYFVEFKFQCVFIIPNKYFMWIFSSILLINFSILGNIFQTSIWRSYEMISCSGILFHNRKDKHKRKSWIR